VQRKSPQTASDHKKEMIMSTIALKSAFEAATVEAPASPKSGFFKRFMQARERAARERVLNFLAAQTDGQLTSMGYTAEQIGRLRQGKFTLPTH
jgi:hypothetical protein